MEYIDSSKGPEQKSAKRKPASRRNVTCELPAFAFEALQEDAGARGLDSLHQRGREIVIDYLSNQTAVEAAERVSAVEQEVAGLREDISHIEKLLRRLAYVTIALSNEGESDEAKARQSDKANDWVKRNMPKRTRS